MARELFAAGFVACWSELDPVLQEQLVRSLEAALASPTIPPETVTALLNLAGGSFSWGVARWLVCLFYSDKPLSADRRIPLLKTRIASHA